MFDQCMSGLHQRRVMKYIGSHKEVHGVQQTRGAHEMYHTLRLFLPALTCRVRSPDGRR